jgi:protein-S-isoprenylcysteine O-methyltransferase Ste14
MSLLLALGAVVAALLAVASLVMHVTHKVSRPLSAAALKRASRALVTSLVLLFMCAVRLLAVGQWKASIGLLVVLAVVGLTLVKPAQRPQRLSNPRDGGTGTESADDDLGVRLNIP